MVDFRKRLGGVTGKQSLDPVEIYEKLDRETDKGELRKAQLAVLREWNRSRRSQKDVIVKLHTGQGKTLIGMLALQSKLNEEKGPALYLCPDNFLAEQTAAQARQFGFSCETISGGDEIPSQFIDSKAILVTSVQKLFNGLTKFGLGTRSIPVGAIVVDDVHSCINSIRNACSIRLDSKSQPYALIRDLFASGLKSQGEGSYADLLNNDYDALLPVPYWDWLNRTTEIAKILATHSSSLEIKFAWPLIRDILPECDCLVSGTSIEIYPRIAPLAEFGSYERAAHRIFMSATVSDDSFLIKGLRLSPETVKKPLTFSEEKWSGEKMILVPSLIDEALDRASIVQRFSQPPQNKQFGVIALTPSFKRSGDWKAYGATIADTNTIHEEVQRFRKGEFQKVLAIANRYDGIDLPDKSCRVLIFDSKPCGETLLERYIEKCVPEGDAVVARTARAIEQGLGRSVRGEKDYSVILMIGEDLIRFIRLPKYREYLSGQTKQQIEIGLGVTGFVSEEIGKGKDPMEALLDTVNQCLRRDEDWKSYYAEYMEKIDRPSGAPKRLEVYSKELEAESKALLGKYDQAAEILQSLIDQINSEVEKAWYMQEMARHLYRSSKLRSEEIQNSAHGKNRLLLRPISRSGTTEQLTYMQNRVQKVIEWVKEQVTWSTLNLTLQNILTDLNFGVEADRFEAAMDSLGKALGFACERPDKEWKEGPDNLWRIQENLCLIIECKNDVALTRAEVEKRETEQMNRSFAWFQKVYPAVQATCIMVTPAKKLANAAALLQPMTVLNPNGLDNLKKNVRSLFNEFERLNFQDLSKGEVSKLLETHMLGSSHILSSYAGPVKSAGLPN